ncbi:MAG: triose-phosphate isomerase [Bacteroidota bacterium]
MSRKMVAGNWKMNTSPAEGTALASGIIQQSNPEVPVVFGVPAIQLINVQKLVSEQDHFFVAAQNMHQADSGAFTGEISAPMLAEAGIDYVILGHSERREYFGETDELIGEKVRKAIEYGIKPIYCCGEKLNIREAGNHEEHVGTQLQTALFDLSPEQFAQVVIAYEPVWAIGTGKTASPEQAQAMHAHLRSLIADKFGAEIAEATAILYGGSVKPANAQELFSQPDVDGGLVGGASLKVTDFANIIAAI